MQGLERAVLEGADCYRVLWQTAAARGALNGLMAEVLEGHVKHHILDPEHPPKPEQAEAADMLVDLIRSFLK